MWEKGEIKNYLNYVNLHLAGGKNKNARKKQQDYR